MRWAVLLAVIVGVVAWLTAGQVRDDERRDWSAAMSGHSSDVLRVGIERAGPQPEFNPSPVSRWPWLMGVVAAGAVLLVGSVVVIAINSEKTPKPPASAER